MDKPTNDMLAQLLLDANIEKSVEEVAEIVGIPANTVKTRMFYARKRLAELLKSEGIERGWP